METATMICRHKIQHRQMCRQWFGVSWRLEKVSGGTTEQSRLINSYCNDDLQSCRDRKIGRRALCMSSQARGAPLHAQILLK
jgi:hypothetical protein